MVELIALAAGFVLGFRCGYEQRENEEKSARISELERRLENSKCENSPDEILENTPSEKKPTINLAVEDNHIKVELPEKKGLFKGWL